MLGFLLTRDRLDVNVLHDRNPVVVQLSDGSIRNGYTIKVLNMKPEPRFIVALWSCIAALWNQPANRLTLSTWPIWKKNSLNLECGWMSNNGIEVLNIEQWHRDAATPLQLSVMQFVRDYTYDHGYQPSHKDIASHFGWNSTDSVTTHINALFRKGLARSNGSRALQFIQREHDA